jgi:hypothetical protein
MLLFQDSIGMSITLFIQISFIQSSNAGMSLTRNQVHSLVLAYHRATSLWLHKMLHEPIPSSQASRWMLYLIIHRSSFLLRSAPMDERHPPSTLEFEKKWITSGLSTSSTKGVDLLLSSAYIEQDVPSLQYFHVSQLERCLKALQRCHQQSGPTGGRSPYPQQSTEW